MTKEAFIKRLDFSLNYMEESERKKVVKYYRKAIFESDDTIEKIVAEIGTPEDISKQMKDEYFELKEEMASSEAKVSENTESAEPEILQEKDEESEILPLQNEDKEEEPENETISEETEASSEDEDLIFSKKHESVPDSEIIHDIEGKDITPIFKNTDPFEAKTQELPGFEKVKTLEKAEQYSLDIEEDTEEETESEEIDSEIELEEVKPKKKYVSGILEKYKNKKASLIMLSILISPFVFLAMLLSFIAFLAVDFIILFVGIAAFLVMAVIAVFSAIEIVYSISVFTVSKLPGLIEMGVALIILGISIFVITFIYKYLFDITPSFFKKTFYIFKKSIVSVKNKIWGGYEI